MKNLLSLFFTICVLFNFAQTSKQKIIVRTTIGEYQSTDSRGVTTTKSTTQIDFKVGNSDFKNIGRKGREIEPFIMQNEIAYKEFQNYLSLNKKKNLQIGVACALAVPLLVGGTIAMLNSEDVPNTKFIAGASIAAASFIPIMYLNLKIPKTREKSMEAFYKSVQLYNANLN